MKKTVRSLVCALLVFTMVLAMVPMVSASGDPTILYVGDEVVLTDVCTNPDHASKRKVTYTNHITGVSATSSTNNSYLGYTAASGKVKAVKATAYTSSGTADFGYVEIAVKCEVASCSKPSATGKYTVYSKANSIQLKQNTTVIGNNDVLTIMKGDANKLSLNYSVLSGSGSSVTTAKQNVKIEGDPSGVIKVGNESATTGSASVTVSDNEFTIFGSNAAVGYFTITADPGTNHAVSRKVGVVVVDKPIITIKNGSTVIAKTGDTDKVLYAKVGDKLKLTAEVEGLTGESKDVTWTSDTTLCASFNASNELVCSKAGDSMIMAKGTKSEASFTLRVLPAIDSVAILGADDKELAKYTFESKDAGPYTVKAELKPDTIPASTKGYVSWTSSNYDVVAFWDSDYIKEAVTGASVKLKPTGKGTATITVSLGGKTDTLQVTVGEKKNTKYVWNLVGGYEYAIPGTASDKKDVLIERMQVAHPSVPMYVTDIDSAPSGSNKTWKNIPVMWQSATTPKLVGDKLTTTLTGVLQDSDETYSFTFRGAKEDVVVLKDVVLTDMEAIMRDYKLDVALSKSSITIGESATATATLKYKGTTVTGASISWEVLNGTSSVDAKFATLSKANEKVTVTAKSTDSANGLSLTVKATVKHNSYTFTESKTLTIKPIDIPSLTMKMGSGATINADQINKAITDKLSGSNASAAYVVFSNLTAGTLKASSSGKELSSGTECYFNAPSGKQKLSSVYYAPKEGTDSATVSYTAYNNDGGVVATGSITFDSKVASKTLYSTGVSLEAFVPDMQGMGGDSVTFNSITGGKLYYNYRSFLSKQDVKSGDKFNLTSGSALVKDVYVLPAADVKEVVIKYTVGSSEQTLKLTVNQQTSSRVFNDVTNANGGSWSANGIDFMQANDLVGGVGGGKFAPTQNMTRGQLVTVLYRIAGSPSVAGLTMPFSDVAAGKYYYNAVLWASSKGIVGGSNGKYSPEGNITRQDIAAILYRYAGSPISTGAITGFSDNKNVSNYAVEPIKWAVGAGIIGGSNGKLDPKGQATRAQVAVMLYRFLTK